MRALSLTQPWATLVGSTPYRGPLAIHASKGFPGYAKECCFGAVFQRHLRRNEGGLFYVSDLIKALPLGAIIATAKLVDCVSTNFPMTFGFDETRKRPLQGTPEYSFGDYSPNRFMWFLEDVRELPAPIPCKGALGLWKVPRGVADQIMRVLVCADQDERPINTGQ